MKDEPLKVEIVNTSHGLEYKIVDKDGTIYATTYDKAAAEICAKALNKYYPVA